MNLFIGLHLFSALAAMLLGGYSLMRTKGDALHKAVGKTYCGLILLACITSLAIRDENGNFTPIHILTAWTFICIVLALLAIRKKRIGSHRRFMQGTYAGLVIAGVLATAMPGRILHTFLFG